MPFAASHTVPSNDQFPVLPFRSTLYDPAELFDGFDPADPGSYAATPDFRAYRSTLGIPTRDVGMLRALHDQCITDARDATVAGRHVVAVMGGHDMPRSSSAYALVVELAAALASQDVLVASGGGPGAMEATHLGAMLSSAGRDEREQALLHLSVADRFPGGTRAVVGPDGALDVERLAQLHAWQRPAFEVLADVAPDDRTASLAVPTWFYGHEPPTPFATHIAKYFSNSLREDGLLGVAADGVVFAPGRAGTLQEVFQDAAQNYYRVYGGRFSPMVFLDIDGCWSERFPIGPILRSLFGDEDHDRHVLVTADLDAALAFLASSRATPDLGPPSPAPTP